MFYSSEIRLNLWKSCEMENILWQTESVQRFVDIFDEYEGPLLPSGKCLKDNTASYETTKRLHVWTSIGNLEGAIEEANKSICFAETGSSYLGLAYSIRAHFFARLEQYSMCLADIALAEENRYPSFMRPILLERRDDYLEAMNEVDPEDSWPNVEPELSFPSNPKFPCLAHGLEVKHSLQYGKHIITTRDLQIGQTVIVEEAYCIASEPNQKYSQCANCFKRKANLIPCKNCADIMFCSQSCYDIGHESFHAADCGITSICSKWDIVRRMATQTIMKAIKAFSNVDELIDVIRTFIIRESNGEESFYPDPSVRAYMQFFGLRRGFGLTIEILEFTYMTNIKAVHLQVLSNATCNSFFRTDESKRFLGHLIMHHFHIINKNELDAVSLLRGTYINELGANAEHSGGITYAHGIYPNSNQLNHSCQPNVALIFIRNKVAVKVIRPIERGEQLFVSYL